MSQPTTAYNTPDPESMASDAAWQPQGDEMRGPVRVTAADGSRYYLWKDPVTGEEDQFWSVTTVLSAKNKEGLKWWAAKLAAQRATANLPRLLAAQLFEPCGQTWKRSGPSSCGQCPDCVQRWVELFHVGESNRRKHEGSAVHDALEAFIKFGPDGIPTVATLGQRYAEDHPQIFDMLPPYLDSLLAWIERYAIEPGDFEASEMTVYNDELRYGGTLDAIWQIHPRNKESAKLLARVRGDCQLLPTAVVLDCKTREGDGKAFYDEHPLQLAPYRFANWCMPSKEDRVLFPMIPTDGAVVLQLRPDGFTCEPVRAEQGELNTFLSLLDVFRWQVTEGASAIAVKTFPVPEGFEWPPTAALEGTADARTGAAEVLATEQAPAPAPAAKKTAAKRAPRKTIPRPVTDHQRITDERGVSRAIGSATIDSISRTGGGRAGATLTDEDIPF